MKAAIDECELSGLGRNVVQLMKERKLPTNVVELVPRGAIERMAPASEKSSGRRYPLARLAREQGKRQAATVACEATALGQLVDEIPDVAQVEEKPPAGGRCHLQATDPEPGHQPGLPNVQPQLHYKAEECFDLAQMPEGVTVVVWKLDRVDDWMAPVLGVCCKDLLAHGQVRKAVFDLSRVENISTAAIATLVRFRNTACHLDMTVHVVAGPRLRAELARAAVDRVMDVRDNIYALIQPAAAKPGLFGRLFGKR